MLLTSLDYYAVIKEDDHYALIMAKIDPTYAEMVPAWTRQCLD